LEHMPERAAAVGPADLGLAAHASVAGATAGDRGVLELDQPPITGGSTAPFAGTAPALLETVLGAGGFASVAGPLKLDPLATRGDDAYFVMLANLANLPEVIRAELPGRYGEVPRSPTEGIGLPDDDVPIAPLPLRDDGDPVRVDDRFQGQ